MRLFAAFSLALFFLSGIARAETAKTIPANKPAVLLPQKQPADPVKLPDAASLPALAKPATPPGAQPEAAPPLKLYEDVKPGEAFPFLGKKVQGRNGETLGQVVDLLIDEDGRPRAAIVDFGGFLGVGTRRVAVGWIFLQFDPTDRDAPIKLDVSQDMIKAAPEYKPEGTPTPAEGAMTQAEIAAQPPAPVAETLPNPVPAKAAEAALDKLSAKVKVKSKEPGRKAKPKPKPEPKAEPETAPDKAPDVAAVAKPTPADNAAAPAVSPTPAPTLATPSTKLPVSPAANTAEPSVTDTTPATPPKTEAPSENHTAQTPDSMPALQAPISPISLPKVKPPFEIDTAPHPSTRNEVPSAATIPEPVVQPALSPPMAKETVSHQPESAPKAAQPQNNLNPVPAVETKPTQNPVPSVLPRAPEKPAVEKEGIPNMATTPDSGTVPSPQETPKATSSSPLNPQSSNTVSPAANGPAPAPRTPASPPPSKPEPSEPKPPPGETTLNPQIPRHDATPTLPASPSPPAIGQTTEPADAAK